MMTSEDESVKIKEVKKAVKMLKFTFPIQGVTIEAESYEEALKILQDNNNQD